MDRRRRVLLRESVVDKRWGRYMDSEGRWVKKKEEKKDEKNLAVESEAPRLGLLTHTVVQSPAVRWILKFGSDNYDVAFIGEHSIRVETLQASGSFAKIWELQNIRTRIRNADVFADRQCLVLALESGDLLFVDKASTTTPIFTRHQPRDRAANQDFPGTLIATDPTQCYVAVACSQSSILVVAPSDVAEMKEQPANQRDLKRVRDEFMIDIKGSILKMAFQVFLGPDDCRTIILIVVAACGGSLRFHTFKWVAGTRPLAEMTREADQSGDISDMLESRGVGVPLLLIPLPMSGSDSRAFLLAFEGNNVVRYDRAAGGEYYGRRLLIPEQATPSDHHVGSYQPLWVHWWGTGTSDIVLVREDGVMLELPGVYAKITVLAQPVVDDSYYVRYPCNIGTAFSVFPANLVVFEGRRRLVYLVGGQAGPGSVLVITRNDFELLSTIPNWAPLNDFQSTPETTQMGITQPGRIFGCSGIGNSGYVSELSRKIEALVKFEVDGIGANITGIWAVPNRFGGPAADGAHCDDPDILVSFRDRSLLLSRVEGEAEMVAIAEEDTWFDLSSKTFHASFREGYSVQITEREVQLIKGTPTSSGKGQCYVTKTRFHADSAVAACSNGSMYAICRHNEKDGYRFEVLSIDTSLDSPAVQFIGRGVFECSFISPPKSLSMIRLGKTDHLVVGCETKVRENDNNVGVMLLPVYPVSPRQGYGNMLAKKVIHPYSPSSVKPLGNCISAGLLRTEKDPSRVVLLIGHMGGTLTWCSFVADANGLMQARPTRGNYSSLGTSEVYISTDDSRPDIALITCGNSLFQASYSPHLPHITKVSLSEAVHLPGRGRETRPHEGLEMSLQDRMQQMQIDQSAGPGNSRTLICNLGKDFLICSGQKVMGCRLGHETTSFSNIGNGSISLGDEYLSGPANKMLILDKMNAAVVASTKADRYGRPKEPALVGYGLNGDLVEPLISWDQPADIASMNKPERILCMIQIFFPKVDEAMVMVGTSRGSLTLAANHDPASLREVADGQCDGPVHALIQSSRDHTIVYACIGTQLLMGKLINPNHDIGQDVFPDDFELTTGRRLPSHGVSMTISVSQDKKVPDLLMVLTAEHSLVVFALDESGVPHLRSVNEEQRHGLDHISRENLSLVSDSDCGVIGLYTRGGMPDPNNDVPLESEKVFEAELPVSIRKFAFVNCRPSWDVSRGGNPMSFSFISPWDDSGDDILGIALDGSVHHFTVLSEPLTQLLALLQHFALQDPEVCPADLTEPETDFGELEFRSEMVGKDHRRLNGVQARSHHIDGNILKELLRVRNLGDYLMNRVHSDNPLGTISPLTQFLLACIECDAEWAATPPGKDGHHKLEKKDLFELVEKVYELLEYLLRPVF